MGLLRNMKLEEAKLGLKVITKNGNVGVIDCIDRYAKGYVRVKLESGSSSIVRVERLSRKP